MTGRIPRSLLRGESLHTLNIKISGITCEACIKLIKRRVGKIVDVTGVEIADKTGVTNITSKKNITLYDVNNVLSDTSYRAY